jgi:hypothetical protein
MQGRVCYAKECEEARECAALKGRRNSASQSCYVRNVATYDRAGNAPTVRIPFISTFTDPVRFVHSVVSKRCA